MTERKFISKENLIEKIQECTRELNFTKWANGKTGAICYLEDDLYHFVECRNERLVSGESEWIAKTPVVARGILAYWLRHRKLKPIPILFEEYFQIRLKQYRDDRTKDPDSWKVDIEQEFISEIHLNQEEALKKQSDGIYEFLDAASAQLAKEIVENYMEFVREKAVSRDNGNEPARPGQNAGITGKDLFQKVLEATDRRVHFKYKREYLAVYMIITEKKLIKILSKAEFCRMVKNCTVGYKPNEGNLKNFDIGGKYPDWEVENGKHSRYTEIARVFLEEYERLSGGRRG